MKIAGVTIIGHVVSDGGQKEGVTKLVVTVGRATVAGIPHDHRNDDAGLNYGTQQISVRRPPNAARPAKERRQRELDCSPRVVSLVGDSLEESRSVKQGRLPLSKWQTRLSSQSINWMTTTDSRFLQKQNYRAVL